MRFAAGMLGAIAIGAGLIGASLLVSSPDGPASAQTPAKPAPIKVSVRRITETQYRHTIADVLGPTITINARFEPDKREEGLLAIGSAQLSLTSSGFEQYFALASSISDQALDSKRRPDTVVCQPADATKADLTCARMFITRVGERLFHRPLTEAEIASRLTTASTGAAQTNDFYAGLKLALTSLLMDPDFLFRVETAEPDPAKAGTLRLDGYSKAARVSFLLWDSAPDKELLESARTGAIHTDAGLKQQLDRMTASPRFQDGVRAFFTDMLQLDGFDNLIKDPASYPKFNQSVADSAKEQTLRTTLDLLVNRNLDYRELFTSNETFIDRYLAAVYKVPFAAEQGWTKYTFPPASERAGILTQVSFLSLFAHPGASSPTRRGVKVHEIFMCEPRSDPPGLALEHFDGLGQLRTVENGARIDVSADLGDKKIDGAQGLAAYLRDDPKIPACLVRNVYAYGVGKPTDERDEDYLADQTKAFAANGYRLKGLITQVASSPEFFKVIAPAGAKPAATPAPAANKPIPTSAKPQ